jgi:hypothetical protein
MLVFTSIESVSNIGTTMLHILLLVNVVTNTVNGSTSGIPSAVTVSVEKSPAVSRTVSRSEGAQLPTVAPQPPPPTSTPTFPAANSSSATPRPATSDVDCDDTCTALAAGLGGAAACFLILGSALGYYLYKRTDPYAVIDHSYQLSPLSTLSMIDVSLLVNNDVDTLQRHTIQKEDFNFI